MIELPILENGQQYSYAKEKTFGKVKFTSVEGSVSQMPEMKVEDVLKSVSKSSKAQAKLLNTLT